MITGSYRRKYTYFLNPDDQGKVEMLMGTWLKLMGRASEHKELGLNPGQPDSFGYVCCIPCNKLKLLEIAIGTSFNWKIVLLL